MELFDGIDGAIRENIKWIGHNFRAIFESINRIECISLCKLDEC